MFIKLKKNILLLIVSFSFLGFNTSCKFIADKSGDLKHERGAITPNDRAPWMWIQVDNTEQLSLAPPQENREPAEILPENNPMIVRLNFWLEQIHRNFLQRYPEQFKHVILPRVVVYNAKNSTMSQNAYVIMSPICVTNFKFVRDVKGYRSSKTKEVEEIAFFSLFGRQIDENNFRCILDRSIAPTELDERIQYYNRSNQSKSSCVLKRDNDLVTITNKDGRPCAENIFGEWAKNKNRSARIAVGSIVNRVYIGSDLIASLTEDEIIGIVSHELGHYYAAHMLFADPDFGRFYRSDKIGERKNSRPKIPSEESNDPIEKEIFSFEKKFLRFKQDNEVSLNSDIILSAANDFAVTGLNKRNISAYSYPHINAEYPLELYRFLLTGLANMGLVLSNDKNSQLHNCIALVEGAIAPGTPVQQFMTTLNPSEKLVQQASQEVNQLWKLSKPCLTYDTKKLSTAEFVPVAYGLLDIPGNAWEGTTDILAVIENDVKSGKNTDTQVSPADTNNVYDYYGRVAKSWIANNMGRRGKKVDLKELSKPLKTYLDPSDYDSIFASGIKSLEAEPVNKLFLEKNKNILQGWNYTMVGYHLGEQLLGLLSAKKMAIYSSEDHADQLALELLAGIGFNPRSYGDAIMKILFKDTSDPFFENRQQCDALRKKGWPTPPVWGDPSGDHAASCYRIFNIDAEIALHAYKIENKVDSSRFGNWKSTIQEQENYFAALLVSPAKNKPNVMSLSDKEIKLFMNYGLGVELPLSAKSFRIGKSLIKAPH